VAVAAMITVAVAAMITVAVAVMAVVVAVAEIVSYFLSEEKSIVKFCNKIDNFVPLQLKNI
jgi:hypothetical protein